MDRFICEEATKWMNSDFFNFCNSIFLLIRTHFLDISFFFRLYIFLSLSQSLSLPFSFSFPRSYHISTISTTFTPFGLLLHANLWIMLWGCNCDRTNWISGVWRCGVSCSEYSNRSEKNQAEGNKYLWVCMCVKEIHGEKLLWKEEKRDN